MHTLLADPQSVEGLVHELQPNIEPFLQWYFRMRQLLADPQSKARLPH
jgi:hypothetical protein